MKHPVLDNRRRLRVVAVVDLIKGVLVLGIALGILRASSHVLENGGLALLHLLDVDANLGLPHKFLMLLQVADGERGWITLAAAGHPAPRFHEGLRPRVPPHRGASGVAARAGGAAPRAPELRGGRHVI